MGSSPKVQTKNNQKASQKVAEIDFIENQIDNAISTFTDQFKLIIQILTVLVVANVTILGYAISTKLAGMIFVGAAIPVTIIYVLYGASRFMAPIVYTAVSLENKYGQMEDDLLISTFLSYVISRDYMNTLCEISNIQDPSDRLFKLRKIGFPIFNRRSFQITLLLISLAEIILPFVLQRYFGWQIF